MGGIVFFAIVGVIIFLLYLHEAHKVYTNADFYLWRVEKPEDNTYYFEIRIAFYQYKKAEEARKRYGQNSIIYSKEDNSYHRVLKWGARVHGMQRIIAEPYIVEETIHQNNYTIYVSNSGSLYIDLSDREANIFDDLYQEIAKEDCNVDAHEKDTVLNILKDLKERRVVKRNILENLCAFLKKYDTLFSCASNVLSIVSSIMGFIH